jgi:hypothetical protein
MVISVIGDGVSCEIECRALRAPRAFELITESRITRESIKSNEWRV